MRLSDQNARWCTFPLMGTDQETEPSFGEDGVVHVLNNEEPVGEFNPESSLLGTCGEKVCQ